MREIIKCTVIFILQFTTIISSSSDIDEDLTLSYNEKLTLDKFKARVTSILPHRYMREDSYLINWLRTKEFNIPQAEKFLKDNLRWRKLNGIDRIHEEDFSELLEEYPVQVDTYDKNGSPVMTVSVRDWDIRQAVLFRMQDRLRRLATKIFDEACVKIRAAQLAGKNVTRFHMLWNMQGFTLAHHGCASCTIEIRSYFQIYENYFPAMADKIVLINTPAHLQIIRPLVREVLSGRTRSHLQILGKNKSEWQRTLLDFIDSNQLTAEFGGTRTRQVKTNRDSRLLLQPASLQNNITICSCITRQLGLP